MFMYISWIFMLICILNLFYSLNLRSSLLLYRSQIYGHVALFFLILHFITISKPQSHDASKPDNNVTFFVSHAAFTNT